MEPHSDKGGRRPAQHPGQHLHTAPLTARDPGQVLPSQLACPSGKPRSQSLDWGHSHGYKEELEVSGLDIGREETNLLTAADSHWYRKPSRKPQDQASHPQRCRQPEAHGEQGKEWSSDRRTSRSTVFMHFLKTPTATCTDSRVNLRGGHSALRTSTPVSGEEWVNSAD